MAFNNSSEFLKHLQKEMTMETLYKPNKERSKWNKDFNKISKDRLKKNGVEQHSIRVKKNHFDEQIGLYVNEIAKGLSETQKQKIGNGVSIGSVNSTDINAICTTDNCGNYAVIVNSGLFTYLHKYGKLSIALSNPSSVIYCKSKSFDSLTKDDISGYIEELPKLYFANNQPMGAMIHLDEKHAEYHMTILQIAEMFIVGHELGHFFKGHLDKSSNTELYLNAYKKLKNNNHLLEFEADDFAYELISKRIALLRNQYDYNMRFVSLAINLLFRALNSLNPHASETHPAPIERMNRLLDRNKPTHKK